MRVLHEDNHLLIVEKPAGTLVQGDATGDPCLLDIAREYIAARYDKPGRVFIAAAHRLDRPVSGVLVLARTSKAASRLAESFRTGKVEKEYLAVVHGAPSEGEGEVRSWLLKDRRTNMVSSSDSVVPGGKLAHTRYRVLARSDESALVALEPVTGRSHQLRVHMRDLGCPIVGDLRYGPGPGLGSCILLHCRRISVPHPVGGRMMGFVAPLPSVWNEQAAAGGLLTCFKNS